MRVSLFLIVLSAVSLGATSAALADAWPNAADKAFVAKASQGGTEEVAFAKLAAARASSPAVRRFAHRMAHDHGMANAQLAEIAKRKHIRIVTTMDAQHKAMYRRLSHMTGRAFDKAYLSGQIQDHVATVALFQHEAGAGDDSDLRNFDLSTLPTIQNHLQMAQDIAGGKMASM